MSTNDKVRRIVTIAIFTGLAIALSIAESFIPFFVPGVKIGLANVVVLMAFYIYSWKEALLIDIIRILVVGLTYSGIFSVAFILSLSGGMLSFISMLFIYKIRKDDITVVSITGSVMHSIGQIIAASIIIKSIQTLYYLPIMLMVSIPMGIITSLIARLSLRSFKITLGKIRPISIIMSVAIVTLLTIVTFVMVGKKNNIDTKNKICHVYVDNIDVLDIALNDFTYKASNGVEVTKKEEAEYYSYTFDCYNHDLNEKKPYEIILYKNGEVSIGETSCKNKTCKHSGKIVSGFERIICIPNRVVVKIETSELPDIDNII